jgi:hypothetical protein
MKTAVTPAEISYLAMLAGADEVFGIPDVYYGKTDGEIRAAVKTAEKTCLQKNLYTVDFNGNRNLSPAISETVALLSFPVQVTEIILRNTKCRQTRYLIFRKNGGGVILRVEDEGFTVCGEGELQALKTELRIFFAQGCMLRPGPESFTVTHAEAAAIRAGRRPKAGALRALLRDKGADDVTALLITEAMAGSAGYFSAVAVRPAQKQNCKSVFYLADSGVALQMKIDPERAVRFELTECGAAMRTAAAFIGGDFHV